jgi:catechol 2,3-dioxygenase-like lactoylglutathione lyase family enzyme
MKVYRISAVTLKVRDMGKSYKFYSKLPGFKLVYGGAGDSFTTFEVGKTYLNLELIHDANRTPMVTGSHHDTGREDFGRIIFHTENLDSLYLYMKNDETISEAVIFENEPTDAPWGERFFHIREPDGYQLSFAQPISKEMKYYCE